MVAVLSAPTERESRTRVISCDLAQCVLRPLCSNVYREEDILGASRFEFRRIAYSGATDVARRSRNARRSSTSRVVARVYGPKASSKILVG